MSFSRVMSKITATSPTPMIFMPIFFPASTAFNTFLLLPLVLIANDQEWAARSLETLLGPNGYAVLRAYNGRQAVEMARSVQPDVVIVDLRLPDTDGLDVCRTLRASGSSRTRSWSTR